MADPRNVAHDKKVIQEKEKEGEDPSANLEHVVQPGKKTKLEDDNLSADEKTEQASEEANAGEEIAPG